LIYVADLGKTVTVEEVNNAFISAKPKGPLKGILARRERKELVSSDFNGCQASSSVTTS